MLNPFQIFHKKRAPLQATQSGKLLHLTWERKELPGAGAGQYAWETLGLPVYYAYGNVGAVVTNPLQETFPGSYAFQTTGIVGIPPTGILQGQFVTQPLMDPNEAENLGFITPGSVPAAPNAILSASPILSG